MNNLHNPNTETAHYQIRLKGHLGSQWGCWFDGLTVELTENGQTVLSGVVDQAALYGLLRKARDLGLPLLSVCCLDDGTWTNADKRG